MENVYMAAIIVSVLVFTVLICLCSMSGYTTKHKNPDDYMEINQNAEIVVEATDSGDGLTRAMSGELDLGMASRDLKDYEIELLDYEAIAEDDIAVIVNAENPLENITTEALRNIFTGEFTKWEELNQD